MYQQILVAVDGSETSARAFDAALQLARESGAQLQPLYVVDVPLMSYDAPRLDFATQCRPALLYLDFDRMLLKACDPVGGRRTRS